MLPIPHMGWFLPGVPPLYDDGGLLDLPPMSDMPTLPPPTGGARPITSITPQSGRPVCGPDRGQSGLPTAVQICPEGDAVCGVRQGEDGGGVRLKERI